MKKPFLILVILLLISMVSMVTINPVGTQVTRIFVDPSSINLSQSPQSTTIRPNADSLSSAFKDWTNNTVVLEPNSEGYYSDWTGRSLTLNPSGEGTYSEWPAWVHLQPRGDVDGNYSDWAGTSRDWNDWPNPNGDTNYVYAPSAEYNNANFTSALNHPPTELTSLNIQKVRANIVAKYNATSNELLQIMLASVLNASASSFTAETGWNGWSRTGSSPWLDKEDWSSTGGNYINTSTGGDKIGNFTFADIPAGLTWSSHPHTTRGTGVQVRLRTWQNPLGDDSLKVYLYNGTHWKLLPILTPDALPDPSYISYGTRTDIDVADFLDTTDKINNAQMRIEKVTVGTPDTIYVDYACIRLSGVRKTASYGPSILLTTSYATYSRDWSTNPITGSGWTWADIDTLQAGVKAIQSGSWTGEMRVTQLYVGILTSQGLYKDWDDWPDPTGPNGGDEDYFVATADALRQTSALPNYAASPPFSTPSKVRVTITARVNASTDEKVQPLLVPGPPTTTPQANVDGFDNTWTGWTRVPPGATGPWLDAADYPTNYIYTTGNLIQIGAFSFQDVTTGLPWSTVKLRIKTWQSSGGDDTLKIELSNDGGTTWGWTFTITPSTTAGYWEFDVSTFLDTATKINAAKMRLTKIRIGGGGSDDTVYVDHAYLFVSLVTHSLTTTYTEYSSEWSKNPATGLDWTWSAIDALEVGVKSIQTGTTWTGEIRVTQIYVKVMEAGTYAHWDEPPPDHNSDTDYNSATSGALSQTSVLQDLPTTWQTWTISRVQVTIVARRTGGDDQIKIRMRLGTTNLDSLNLLSAGATTYATYSYASTTKPGGGAWTWSDVNNLEAGVLSVLVGASFTEVRVTQLYVVVGRDGTYQNWDETSANGDTDYNSATMSGMKESSQLTDVSDPGWTIGRVRVVIVARTNITTDEQVQPMIYISGSAYFAPGRSLTTSYLTYTGDWGMNPQYYTASPYIGPWNWTAINSLEAGVRSIQTGTEWKGEIRVTQLYVEIAGPRFTVGIKVENVVGLYGYEIKLKYDTAVTTATAIIFNSTFLVPSTVAQYTEVNDAAGYALFSTSSNTGSPVTGSGTLATIIFLIDSTGATTLDLRVKDFYDSSILEIYTILGDVERDRKIDIYDLSILSNAYGYKYGDPSWTEKSKCDFNSDNQVDVFDLFDQSKNYGKAYAYDGYFSNSP